MLGIKAKFYRNTGSFDSPSWSECTLLSDCAVNPSWDSGDASDRGSRIKVEAKTQMGLEFPCKMRKVPGDANYEAFMNALLSDATLDLLVLDGAKETVGARGFRCDCQIFQGNEDQGLGVGALVVDLSIKPAPSGNPTRAVLIGAGPTITYSTPGASGASFA